MTSENKNRAECDKPKGVFSIFFYGLQSNTSRKYLQMYEKYFIF